MGTVSYKVREGFSIRGDVQAIGERIEALKRRHAGGGSDDGYVLRAEVVEAARPTDSPLHREFTWDESRAARKCNLDEAGYLLRAYCKVIVTGRDPEPMILCPANVAVRQPEGPPRFVSPTLALSRDDSREMVLTDARRLLQGVQNRLLRLEGITPQIIQLIDEALDLIGKATSRKRKRKPRARAQTRR